MDSKEQWCNHHRNNNYFVCERVKASVASNDSRQDGQDRDREKEKERKRQRELDEEIIY